MGMLWTHSGSQWGSLLLKALLPLGLQHSIAWSPQRADQTMRLCGQLLPTSPNLSFETSCRFFQLGVTKPSESGYSIKVTLVKTTSGSSLVLLLRITKYHTIKMQRISRPLNAEEGCRLGNQSSTTKRHNRRSFVKPDCRSCGGLRESFGRFPLTGRWRLAFQTTMGFWWLFEDGEGS